MKKRCIWPIALLAVAGAGMWHFLEVQEGGAAAGDGWMKTWYLVLLAAVLFVPGLQIMFAAADLSLSQLTTLAAAAFLPTLAIQIHKILRESIN